MVKLDRVEMLRSAVSGSERGSRTTADVDETPEQERTIALEVQKQKQTQTVRDILQHIASQDQDDPNPTTYDDEHREEATETEATVGEELREEPRDHSTPQESREDVPVFGGAEMHHYGRNHHDDDVTIEAEIETILEKDFILEARDTETEFGEEDASLKSFQSLQPSLKSITPAGTTTPQFQRPLLQVVNEEQMEDGIEVEYDGGFSFAGTVASGSTPDDDREAGPEPSEDETKDVDEDLPFDVAESNSRHQQESIKEAEDMQHQMALVQSSSDSPSEEDAAAPTPEQSIADSYPSLPAVDATWSFDSTMKRKKDGNKTAKAIKNTFPGFKEEDETGIFPEATWSFDTTHKVKKNKNQKTNNFTGFTQEDVENTEKDENTVSETEETISEKEPPSENEEAESKEEPLSVSEETAPEEELLSANDETEPETLTNENNHTEINQSNESKTEVAEPSSEVVEVPETTHETTAPQSMEFDVIIEHVAECIENSDWDAFIAAITSRPSLATLSSVDFFPSECSGFLAVGASENLLLHEVCKNEPTLEAVTALIDLHDAATRAAGQWGYLPVHCACASGASEDVIRELLKAYPESIKKFGDDNMFPLHLACKKDASADIIKFLVTAHPPASVATDVYDKTPMDYVLSQPAGPERAKKLEFLGCHIQSMFVSTTKLEMELRASEERCLAIRKELNSRHVRITSLEKELKGLQKKSVSLEEGMKVKDEIMAKLENDVKQKKNFISELEQEVGSERAKASVFGENLKKELTKACSLESELREERAKSTSLEAELKKNCDEWNVLAKDMEEEFKKSAQEMKKERKRIVELESQLFNEQEKCSIFEAQLKSQCDKSTSLDTTLNDEREKAATVEAEYEAAKLRWLVEKQRIYDKNDSHLAEAHKMLDEAETTVVVEMERWLEQRNAIYEKNAVQMAEAYKVMGEMENKLNGKNANIAMDRQEIYNKVDRQLVEAYKIVSDTEIDLKCERGKWLWERQLIYEKNSRNLAEAFEHIRDVEMRLDERNLELKEYQELLEKRQKQIGEECDKSKTLIRQLELAKAINVEKLKGLGDELSLQKNFSESQSKQIEALEASVELKLSNSSEHTKKEHERLTYEKSVSDEIMARIKEKKELMKENQEMIQILEKSNLMKQELLEAQQKKVEALEVVRREKENQLKLNQEVVKKLEASIAEKQALEEEEAEQAAKLAGTRASRRAAIDIEEDQIKELDYTLARKEALIELEKMKEKTLQQTIAQKHGLIDSEVQRIKELELLIAEKQMQLTAERNVLQALKMARAEKDAMLAAEREVVIELHKTLEEKKKLLESQEQTEALIQAHIKEQEAMLLSKEATIESVKTAQAKLEAELVAKKDASAALEKQITRKKSLLTKEEYIAKCLQQMVLQRRDTVPSGPTRFFLNAFFGMQYSANFGIKSILKETHLVSNFIKTQIRERSETARQRRNDELALVPVAPTVSAVSSEPQSLMARLRSYGININISK